jgi:hypothetical protein
MSKGFAEGNGGMAKGRDSYRVVEEQVFADIARDQR